jgi:hypothetical protein
MEMNFNGPKMNWKINQKIVDTPLVTVVFEARGVAVYLVTKDGSVVEHEPFPGSVEGIVNAIHLAAEVMAGKFYLAKVVSVPEKRIGLEYNEKRKVNAT